MLGGGWSAIVAGAALFRGAGGSGAPLDVDADISGCGVSIAAVERRDGLSSAAAAVAGLLGALQQAAAAA